MLLCCNQFWVGGPQSPFSISSSFILFFVSLPFFLKTKLPGWRPSIAFLYLFLFHSLLRLTSFLSQNQTSGLATLNRLSLSLSLSFSSSSHFLSFSKPKFRVGDPQSPFSISSSFILFFVSLPFFLKTKINFEHGTRCRIRVGQVALVVWRGSEEPHVGKWVFYISFIFILKTVVFLVHEAWLSMRERERGLVVRWLQVWYKGLSIFFCVCVCVYSK